MKVLIALIVLAVSASASAQKRIVSVDAYDLAYSSGLSFKHDNGKGPDRDTTNFRLNLNFAQSIEQYVGLMWRAQLNFNREDVDFGGNDAFSSSYGVAGGVLYNFQADDIKNSFMAGAVAGIERGTFQQAGGTKEAGFNLFLNLEAGKRWDLGSYSAANISYAPTVSLNLKRYGGDIRDTYFKSGRDLRFNFLKFDILF